MTRTNKSHTRTNPHTFERITHSNESQTRTNPHTKNTHIRTQKYTHSHTENTQFSCFLSTIPRQKTPANRTQLHHMTCRNERHTIDTHSKDRETEYTRRVCTRHMNSQIVQNFLVFSVQYHGKKHPMPRQTHRRDWVQANSAHCWHKQTYMICSAADKGAGCRHPLNTSLSWYFDTRSSAASSTGSCPTPSSLCIEALGLCGLPPAFGRAVS